MQPAEEEKAPERLVLGRDVVVSRVNLCSGIVPDKLARLICESRQGPPWSEKVHCPNCGKNDFLISNPEGNTCGECHKGVVEITWTIERATQALLEGAARESQVHAAVLNPRSAPVPIGLIEVLPCELLDLNREMNDRSAVAIVRATRHRGRFAFVRNLSVHEDYAREDIYYALLESAVRSSADESMPFVLLVAESSMPHRICQRLRLPLAMWAKNGALLLGGMLRAH